MTKTEAIRLLGGTIGAAAREIGISWEAVNKWPEELSARISDRVEAALYRRHIAGPIIFGANGVDNTETADDTADAKG